MATHPLDIVNILVVDDHLENLFALRASLSSPHYNVVTASSGEEALLLVLKHEFAVILLDVVMPRMDGFETARLIRQRELSRGIPILFLTAEVSDINLIYKAYSVGAVDYLLKPVDSNVVRAKVAVFAELFRKTQQIRDQQERLREVERIRGERALQESEAQYEATFNEAAVGIAHAKPDGQWLRVNQKFCEMTGYSKEELLQLRFQDLTHPDDLPSTIHAFHQLLAGQVPTYRTEKRYVHKKGHVVWVSLIASVMRDAAGHPKRLIKVVEDITQRKEMEERQRFLTAASEVLLSSLDYRSTLTEVARRAVPQLADWCLVSVAAETAHEPLEVIAVYRDQTNEVVVKRLGSKLPLNAEHGFGKVFQTRKPELIDESPGSPLAEAFPDLPNSESLGSAQGVSAMIVPMMVRDRVLGGIGLLSAQWRRRYGPADLAFAEELAHRAAFAVDNARLYQQAQDAIGARDEFLSIASHELRTPLTPLQLQLQSLVDDRYKGSLNKLSEERLQSVLKRSERQVQRLSALIDNLLDVSRITSGNLRLQLERVDLTEVTRDVAGRFTEELGRAGCPLQVDADGPLLGLWDRLRVEQVITNLLTNAIKYGGGKPIQIALEKKDGRAAKFTIRDQGIGIALEEQARIFERFERAASSRSYGGLGLGLYISRQIISAHSGSIGVESVPGAGAAFWVELPMENALPDESVPRARNAGKSSPETPAA